MFLPLLFQSRSIHLLAFSLCGPQSGVSWEVECQSQSEKKTVKYFVPCWGHIVSVHSHSCSAALAVVFTSLITASALHQWCRWLTMAQSMISRCSSQRRKQATASLYYWFWGLYLYSNFCCFSSGPPIVLLTLWITVLLHLHPLPIHLAHVALHLSVLPSNWFLSFTAH